MSGLSRRKFLHASAAAGAAAVVGVPAVRAVASSPSRHSGSYRPDDHGSAPGSFIVYVKDARHGHVTVLNGENQSVTNDPDLVRRIVRAAKA